MLFIEAPTDRQQLGAIVAHFAGRVPLMVNVVEGGKTPALPAAELEAIGFALVIFPGAVVRAIARTAVDLYASLKQHGTNEPFHARMFDFSGLNAVIGTPEMLARGARYAADTQAPAPRKERA